MRRLLSITALLLTTACAPKGPTHIAPETLFTGLDFREYTDRGFLFTPYRYDGVFESIGLMHVTMWAEGKLVTVSQRDYQTKEWRFDTPEVQDVLKAAYERAREMGADAIVDLELTITDRPIENTTQRLPGIQLSGYAIRRLGAPE